MDKFRLLQKVRFFDAAIKMLLQPGQAIDLRKETEILVIN